jgi:2-iminoacetate synthase ThiH
MDIEHLILAAGRVPVERDTFYNVVKPAALQPAQGL